MIKTIEIIAIIALVIVSFFLGVKYSNSVKSHMSWLETQDEQEVELPDLSNEPSDNINQNSDSLEMNNPSLESNQNIQPIEKTDEAKIEEPQENVAPAPSSNQVPVQPKQPVSN